MKIEEQRREIMYCLVEQGFFDLELYQEGMRRLELDYPPILFHILDEIIHTQINLYLEELIKELKENEE